MNHSVRIMSFLAITLAQGIFAYAGSCCRRVADTRTVGYDINGKPVVLDIGKCTTSCQMGISNSNPEYQSVLERILEKKTAGQNDRCTSAYSSDNGNRECHASLIRVEAVALASGPQVFDVIESCECRKIAKTCQRISKKKKFYAGTRFEAVVDVGQCAGGCKTHKHHKLCQETKTSTRSIKGPNGDIIITSIDQCKCEQACYRQHFNVAVTELTANSNGLASFKTKIIDVGKCAGSCGSVKKCVVRDHKGKDGVASRCLMSLESSDVKCVPTRAHKVKYVDANGQESEVTQVRKCGCS